MSQEDLFGEVFGTYADALSRLARSYEADAEKRRDLLQEIHFAIWRSLASFDRQCSLRTWVYRVAHNVGASHVLKHRRAKARALVTLEEMEDVSDLTDTESSADRRMTLERLHALIHQLHTLDRELVLLYLDGLDASAIGEITGVSAGNVATKLHRIKKILAKQFAKGERHGK